MRAIEILPDTFVPATATAAEVGTHLAEQINGKVSVQVGTKTITTWAINRNGFLSALGFVGRYRTSQKAWKASLVVAVLPKGHQHCFWGRDDRSGRFNKLDGLSFEPENFFDHKGETL